MKTAFQHEIEKLHQKEMAELKAIAELENFNINARNFEFAAMAGIVLGVASLLYLLA